MNEIAVEKNLLEVWIAKKIGIGAGTLTREQISRYQLRKVQETIRQAYRNSPFYRNLLQGFADIGISCLEDLHYFPFTTADHLREQALQFLCVSQSFISRIVTLDSSGTTGMAKRIYFTPFDQELTVDFFQQGMSTLLEPGDQVLILLPGERIGSVGNLLITALERAGAKTILHGVVQNIPKTLEIMVREKVDSLVGIPAQVLALARYTEASGKYIRLKSVLLSTDHVPNAIVQELRRVWGCQVFEHYGMTEMGLGGGLDCEAHTGYHLREADLYFEIIDQAGRPVPEGREGEVVFTTLTRQGMPLIRYRTGDISRFIPGTCACGTILRRLDRITKRKDGLVLISDEQYFTMSDLDETIFALAGVIDFTAKVDNLQKATKLTIAVWTLGKSNTVTEFALLEALNRVPVLRQAREYGKLSIHITIYFYTDGFSPNSRKRTIMELS